MINIKQLIPATMLIASSAASAQDFKVEPNPACTGETVRVVVVSTTNHQIAKFDFGDGTDTYGDNLKHIYQSEGDYTIKLKMLLNDGNWSDESSLTIHIGSSPELELEDNKAAGLLTASSSTDASFEWFAGEQKLANTENTLYYLESGTYTVTATNSNGCSESASLKVTYEGISENDDSYIKVSNNVITPGSRDGINDVLYIQDVANFLEPCSVQIFDKKGKLVYTNPKYTNTDGFQGLDDKGNDLSAGTYYYVIKSQGKKGCTGFVDIIR